MKRITIPESPNAFLIGATQGRQDFAKHLPQIEEANDNTIILLDFKAGTATSSYFIALLVPLLKMEKRLVLINLSDQTFEELSNAMTLNNLAVWVGYENDSGKIEDYRVAGTLDASLVQTLTLLKEKGEATAADLSKEAEGGPGKTGWNNRLASLFGMGLVTREKIGRAMSYRPLVGTW